MTPRERISAECERRGRDAVVADCLALLDGATDLVLLQSLVGSEADRYADGRNHDDMYWLRVWAMRGLLWAYEPAACEAVIVGTRDEAWRVREMASKVVARHLIGDASDAMAALCDDPVPRVRAAAERALVRLTAAGA